MLTLLFSFEHLQSFRQSNPIFFYFSIRTNTFTGARRWAKSWTSSTIEWSELRARAEILQAPETRAQEIPEWDQWDLEYR